MYQRYYDGYPTEAYATVGQNEFDVDSTTENSPQTTDTATGAELSVSSPHNKDIQIETASPTKGGLFSSIKSDDILLIALLIILAAEAPDDTVMPLIIGYILLNDILPI